MNTNTNTTYHSANQNTWTRIIITVTALAAAVMLLAGIAAEAASRGVTLRLGVGGEQPAACRAAHDTTLPFALQAELRAQCAE